MNKQYLFGLLIFMMAITLIWGCRKDDPSINIFSIEDDKALGKQLSEEIAANPDTYPLLDESQYPEAYQHLRRIRDDILNAGNVYYKDEFDWEVHIIHNDTVLNAFCAPGGYIYVYTGLIKYLDSEDQFAGVLAHEIAHADRRHTTDQLTKAYGIGLLFDLILGDKQNTLTEIAKALIQLKYSRKDESEADEYSVRYLCPTDYNAAGAAGFFIKIENSGAQSPPQFLSTHPNPDNRIQNIQETEQELGCTGNNTYESRYQQFKNSLP